jgi:hypothetical protein
LGREIGRGSHARMNLRLIGGTERKMRGSNGWRRRIVADGGGGPERTERRGKGEGGGR